MPNEQNPDSEPCGCCQDAARFPGSGEPPCPTCGHTVNECGGGFTGYDEGCCWTYPNDRQHCPMKLGRPCLCRCHTDVY
jgi:hypothetical protein